MKHFVKKAIAIVLTLATILAICVLPSAAYETEEGDFIPVDAIDSGENSPRAVQYGYLEGTYSENGCTATFRVKVALRDDPDFVSGFSIVAVDTSSITVVGNTGWKYVTDVTVDSYTIKRNAQVAELRVSFSAAESNGIREDFPNRKVTISL